MELARIINVLSVFTVTIMAKIGGSWEPPWLRACISSEIEVGNMHEHWKIIPDKLLDKLF